MDHIFHDALAQFEHNRDWLDRYLDFLEEVGTPDESEYGEAHHILPVSLFPQFKSFRDNPWNCAELRGADHLISHYFLLKALPKHLPLRQAFCFMSGMNQVNELEIPPDLLAEMAEEYAFQRAGLKWMVRDGIEIRILPHEQERYLTDGWKFGRYLILSEEAQKAKIGGSVAWHKLEREKPNAYSSLPRGDQHHRRILGCPPEVRARIAASLTGRIQSPESVERRRLKMIGKRWHWTPEARSMRSQNQTGSLNNRYGLPGHWLGRERSEESKQKVSVSLQRFNQENPDARFASKPRGEDHWTHGKPRSEEDRQKISVGLTGKVQSKETRLKRAESLRLSKMPSFSPEEEAVFRAFCAAQPLLRPAIKKSVPSQNRSAYALMQGLDIILSGRMLEQPRRYWRTAETWLQLNCPAVGDGLASES